MTRVSDGLKQLQRVAPHRSAHGQLYSKTSETKGAWSRIRFWTVFVSDDGDWLLRDHLFAKKSRALTAAEWQKWLQVNLDAITEQHILPGLAVRTGLQKQWSVYHYIGWRPDAFNVANANTKNRARNNTIPEGRTRG